MLIHRGQRRAWSCYKRSRPVASPWSHPASWSHAVVASNALDAMEVLDRRGRVWCHGRIKIHQYPTWRTNNETRPENSLGEGERKKTWLRGSSFGCTTHARIKPNKQSDLCTTGLRDEGSEFGEPTRFDTAGGKDDDVQDHHPADQDRVLVARMACTSWGRSANVNAHAFATDLHMHPSHFNGTINFGW